MIKETINNILNGIIQVACTINVPLDLFNVTAVPLWRMK